MSRGRSGEAPPLYARLLGLRHLAPSGFLCFIFLEGAVALGVLLALAELVSWWGVLLLPASVAAMVKLNDVVAGALTRAALATSAARRPAVSSPPVRASPVRASPVRTSPVRTPPVRTPPVHAPGEATIRLPGVISRHRGVPVMRPWAERVEAHQQRVRQSASRRYE